MSRSEADLPPCQAAVLGEHQLAGGALAGGAVDDHSVAGGGEPEVGPALPAVRLSDCRLPLRGAVTGVVEPACGAGRGDHQPGGAGCCDGAAVTRAAGHARLDPGRAEIAASVDRLDGVPGVSLPGA